MCGVISVPIFSNYSLTDKTISVPGGISYNGLYGEAPPERGTVLRLQLDERVGISSLVELYERVGKSVIWVRKKALKSKRCIFVTVKKSKKSSGFDSDLLIFYRQCIYSNQKGCKVPN